VLTGIDYAARAKEAGLNVYFVAEGDRDGAIRSQVVTPANPTCNCYSVAKAFVVTAFGILYDRGLLFPDMKVFDILGDLFPEGFDRAWKSVTLHNVLLHRIGIEHDCTDIDNETGESYPKDINYLNNLFSLPIVNKPGEVHTYNDAGYYLLSRVIERVSGSDPAQLLRPIMMKQMGFREFAWSVCPDGYCIGATGLYIRTEDMLKLGILYLNSGVWKGERIISREWVDTVLKNHYEFGSVGGGWYAKGGLRGQKLAFNPSLGRAIAWHSFDSVPFDVIVRESADGEEI
jgi:CubicO group peptidase (beta-lactamase class C family)